MKWIFVSEDVLEESNNLFCIQLLTGSWTEPLSIKVQASENMSAQTQAKYLRLGLTHAKEFMHNRCKFTSIAPS